MDGKLLCDHETERIREVMGDTWTGQALGHYIIEPDKIFISETVLQDQHIVEPDGGGGHEVYWEI